jgi:hypothetical protein
VTLVHATLIASHVCSLWGKLINAHPPLWRTLVLHPDCHDRPLHAKLWLERSGDCILDVCLLVRSHVTKISPADGFRRVPARRIGRPREEIAIIHALGPHCHRFRSVSLSVCSLSEVILFMQPILEFPDALETIAIHTTPEGIPRYLFSPWGTVLPPAPRLRSLRFTNAIPSDRFYPHLFRDLEELELDSEVSTVELSTPLHLVDVVSRCPDPRRLKIQGWYNLSPSLEGDGITFQHLPKLKSLCIDGSRNVGWLATIFTPYLQELELTDVRPVSENLMEDWVEAWPVVREFITRSRPPLTTLTLRSIDGYEQGAAELLFCLSLLNDLQKMSFIGVRLDLQAVLDRMGTLPTNIDAVWLCPQLESISLHTRSHVEIVALQQLCRLRPNLQSSF